VPVLTTRQCLGLFAVVQASTALATDWQPGDVFVGVSDGKYEVRSPDGRTGQMMAFARGVEGPRGGLGD
jgi:hypothetical protein